jgi:hypothetical protein
MKKYVIIGIIAASLIATIAGLTARVNYLAKERDIYQSNTHVLLDSIRHYRVNDSLGAVSVRQLQLTGEEYRQYRASDYALIAQLKADRKRLEQVTTVQTQASYEVSAPEVDSVVVRDGIVRDSVIIVRDTLKCYAYEDAWLSFDGCVSGGVFTGEVRSRDSLLYVEHIVPKRFLGFLGKYGVRERRQEIVSRNPHTEVVGAEFVRVRE